MIGIGVFQILRAYLGAILKIAEIQSGAGRHGNSGENDSGARLLRLAGRRSTLGAREGTAGSTLVKAGSSSDHRVSGDSRSANSEGTQSKVASKSRHCDFEFDVRMIFKRAGSSISLYPFRLNQSGPLMSSCTQDPLRTLFLNRTRNHDPATHMARHEYLPIEDDRCPGCVAYWGSKVLCGAFRNEGKRGPVRSDKLDTSSGTLVKVSRPYGLEKLRQPKFHCDANY